MQTIRLVTEGVPKDTVERGLRVLHSLGGGYTLQAGLGDEVHFMAPIGSITGGIQVRLVGGLMARIYKVENGTHEVRISIPSTGQVCVLDRLTAEQLPAAFRRVWNEVADKPV